MPLKELIVDTFNKKSKIRCKQAAYEEVLEWLDERTIDDADGCGHPVVSFISFDYKEEMLQSFKKRFNIE